MQSALFLSKHGEPPPYAVYRKLFDNHQDRILARSKTFVACDDDDTNTILGYVITERQDGAPPILHYVQVKRDLMRKGIASALLEHAGISKNSACVYTFTSPIQGKVKTPEHWVYVPYWLLEND